MMMIQKRKFDDLRPSDWEIHERVQKYFWIFLQNPRKLDASFMSVELIWQHPLD